MKGFVLNFFKIGSVCIISLYQDRTAGRNKGILKVVIITWNIMVKTGMSEIFSDVHNTT